MGASGYSVHIRFGTGKALGALAPVLALLGALAPSAAADSDALRTSIQRVHGPGATASVPVNMLSLNDLRAVNNRITVFIAPDGRLTLVAPEGLADPDGPTGTNCTLDNPQGSSLTATQVSCMPNYVQVIVGELGAGDDTLSVAPGLTLPIGSILDGIRRPMSGGIGMDRIVAGAAADLLDGGAGNDTLLGKRGDDQASGGAGKDKLVGGAGSDGLLGGGGADKLAGGGARDLCNGGAGTDSAKACEILQSIP